MTAKVVTMANKYDSSTLALKALHWLPVHLRIDFKIIILVFKCLNGSAPKYLCSMIKLATTKRPDLRSNNQSNILIVPCTKYSTFADRSFSVCGPKLWNNLPDNLRRISSYSLFRSKLKTHLFNKF